MSFSQDVRQIEAIVRDKGVRDDLKAVRRALENALDHQNRGDSDSAIKDFSHAREILRQLVDTPRGESEETQERIANSLRSLEEILGAGGAGARLTMVETGFGLQTASFDTLQGTVTVNLPDDLAAGDQISGTVVAEPKGNTKEERAKNEDQLDGMVVELAGQQNPAGNNVAKFAIPSALAAVPLVLKSRDGKEIGRAQIPAVPKQEALKKPADSQTIYQTPALAQAGKPVEVKGKFDGDLKSTAINIANHAVKVLAESPRKAVAQSPSEVIGSANIEVKKRGITVARCFYRSIGIRLSAEKLNLIRGEQTTMTVTVLGLSDNGALSSANVEGANKAAGGPMPWPPMRPTGNGVEREAAARVQLVNRSPWVVRMQGGESQEFTATVREAKNGRYSTTRTLTGLKAGSFGINATVEPVFGSGQCQPDLSQANYPNPGPGQGQRMDRRTDALPGSIDSNTPVHPGVSDPSVDANGEPRNSTGSRPVDPLSGTFRVTMNGLMCNRQTRDDALERDGVGDEVTLINHIAMVDNAGRMDRVVWGNIFSSIMGQRPRNEIQAGHGTDRGGLVTGDGFPTPTPWIRSATLNPNIPPNELFEGELIQGRNAALIIPTIWEWDGPAELQSRYAGAIDRDAANISRSVASMINSRTPLPARGFLLPGSSLGIGNTVTLGHGPLGLGEVNNRPIGMQALGGEFGFTPQAVVLTYDLALLAERSDVGFGRGVVPVRYVDERSLEGDYTLFIKVERVDSARPSSPDCDTLASTFVGEATMTITNPNTPNPFRQHITLSVEFSECRAIVRIVGFPAITTEPFDTPIGRNATTVSLGSGGEGNYDPRSGRLNINLTLHLENSLRSPLAGASNLAISLSTSAPGGRAIRLGRGVLAGTGTFRGGFLDGNTGSLVITGEFSPAP